MPITFSKTEKRWLQSLGISRQLLHLWSTGTPVGVKYARKVAFVKNMKLEDVLYPKEVEESDMPSDAVE